MRLLVLLSRRARRRIACAAIACLAASGCLDNELGIEKRRPNQPPETLLSGGPPDSTATDHRVRLRWTGSDPDGAIDHYDFILAEHPPAGDGAASSNHAALRIPPPDDPRWRATHTTDSTFVASADTLLDPDPNGGGVFSRWHTFFVRAVDNEGLVDPSPDYRSFDATNIAPVVYLTHPVQPGNLEFIGPTTIVFNWNGRDPLPDGSSVAPIASRWALVPSRKNGVGDWQGLPEALYALPASGWSAWRDWQARDGTGRSAVVRNLLPVDARGAGYYLFAVQVMDVGGAVTPIFDWTSPAVNGTKNTTKVVVAGGGGPRLEIWNGFTVFNFTAGSQPIITDIATGQTLRFRWSGDASRYGGHIVAYRFGWDLREPENDAAWEQNWSQTATAAPPRAFASGTHSLWVEARDNAELITRARIDFVVRRLTRERELLLVDDTVYSPGDPSLPELAEERRWREVIDRLQGERPFVFDPGRDIFDIAEHGGLVPPVSLLFDYRTVIWSVVAGGRSSSGIRGLARFLDPFDEGRGGASNANYLNVYLDNGGKLWLCGQQLSDELWPLPTRPAQPQRSDWPVGLTRWRLHDPDIPHPDSLGTASLLYRMGIEAVDLGSGGLSLRGQHTLAPGCTGFRRSGPPSGGARQFASSVVQAHTHAIVVGGEAIEAPPPGGLDLTTTASGGHYHALQLTSDALRALGGGEEVEVTTSIAGQPAHTHLFRLVDRLGTWGAPPLLATDPTWVYPSLDNPLRVRQLVEIYNMPDWCRGTNPPLAPPVDRVLPLYLYTSGERLDPDHGPFWPVTADGQPAFVLAKQDPNAINYTRAYCGFEPWRLRFDSHLALARYVLLRQMGVGLPDS